MRFRTVLCVIFGLALGIGASIALEPILSPALTPPGFALFLLLLAVLLFWALTSPPRVRAP